ncbi:MFS transporter [Catellatospora sp. TT07R-123]|uniref:MFS transporter n=1 Tax=Catellatospora sp. TT07R-123 TaxID=2733863 RepID=UPI001B05C1B1|nr:MFS transporter [Catellatospora sp. TT07R-123]GHJ44224.1 MFS transporter [Catellatospora sp. TT07R-123]
MSASDMTAAGPDPRRWKALALLCTAMFVVNLDAQIVLLAIPSIERDLHFTGGSQQWVLSAYLLTFGGLLMLGGRMADLLGRRRMFFIGTALFLLASLLCGFAWTGGVLIAARTLQGASAAVMAPTALSILVTTFDEGSERNRALGIWSGVAGFGATAALLVGGPITDTLGWEWIFFLNVPIALVLLGFGPTLLRESKGERSNSFDIAGAITITLALVLLVYAVVEAPKAGWLSAQTLGLLVASAVVFAVFARVESRSAAPLVPLRIFRSGILVGGNLVMLLLGMIGFGMGLLVSLYAQQVLGYTALLFGLGMAVMTVMTVFGSAGGQALVTRIGFRPVAAGAMALLGIGCVLLSRISADGSYLGDILLPLLVFGPGLGGCYVAATIASQTGVKAEEAGLASGINSASFQIGGALGVAICSTVAAAVTGLATGPVALNEGFQSAFVACAIFAALGLAVALLLVRPSRQSSPAAVATKTPATAQAD